MADSLDNLKKQAEAYRNALTASEKSMLEMQKTFGKIGASLFDLSLSDFFIKIERSPEIMMQLDAEAKKLTANLKSSGDEINKIFSGAFKNTKNGTTAIDKVLIETRKLKNEFPQAADLIEKELENIKKSGLSLKDLDFAAILAHAPEEAADFAQKLLAGKTAAGKLDDKINDVVKDSLKLSEVRKELSKTTTEVLSLTNAFGKFIDRNFRLSDIIKSITDYDKAITDAQRNMGIQFVKNTGTMSKMVVEGARFGLSTRDMAKFMGDLGDTLNTTDFDVLGKAAMDTKAIAAATGLSNDEVAKLTGQFMLVGKHSEDVKEFVEKTAKDSKTFGLNTKKVLEDISKNIPKFRQLGFQGGEESLKKMVILAQKLRMNVDELFNVSEKVRSIEGAMETAASLQLAGGSFSQLDPMQLLAAARKSPEELTKILGQMGKDIGQFDAKTGEVKFDPIDVDRLKMVADATGMTVDSLQKQIAKAKQRVSKEGQGLFSGFAGGLDNETKDMLDQMTNIGRDGKIEFTGALKGMSLDDVHKMTQKDIEKRIAQEQQSKENIEETAKQNMAFTDALTNLKNSFMNVFTVLEPAIRKLTDVLNWVNSFPVWTKYLLAGIGTVLLIAFGPAKAFLNGLAMGKGFRVGAGGGLSSMFGGGGAGGGAAAGAAGQAGNIAGQAGAAGQPGLGNTVRETLTGIADGIKAFADPKVFIGAAGLLLSAPGLVLMTAALPFLLGISLIGKAAGMGLSAFGKGLASFGKAMMNAAPEILVGELLLAGFGAALIPLTYALSLLSPLVDSFGKIIIGVFQAIPPIITAMADGFIKIAAAMGDMAKNLIPLAPGLFILAPALLSAAVGFTAFFLSFANPIAMIGMAMMVMSLGSLNKIMTTLAPNLNKGADAINSMADGVKNLSTALNSINTETLDKLKSINEGVGGSSALAQAVNAIVSATSGTGGAVQKFELEVIVKTEDGREVQRKILRDTDLLK